MVLRFGRSLLVNLDGVVATLGEQPVEQPRLFRHQRAVLAGHVEGAGLGHASVRLFRESPSSIFVNTLMSVLRSLTGRNATIGQGAFFRRSQGQVTLATSRR